MLIRGQICVAKVSDQDGRGTSQRLRKERFCCESAAITRRRDAIALVRAFIPFSGILPQPHRPDHMMFGALEQLCKSAS